MTVPRSFRSRLALIVLVGAILRVALLAHRWGRPLKLNDSLWYSVAATQLRHGEFFRGVFKPGPTAEHAPLTSILMAPLSFLSDPVQGQRLTTTLLGITLVALVGLLGKRVHSPTTGLVAAAIAAIYPNIWIHDGLVMSESIAMVLVVCWMLAILRVLESPSVQRAAVAGAFAGLAALTRSETLLLALAAVLILLWRSRRRDSVIRAAAMTVTTILVLLPWTVINMTRFEQPVLLTTNDGTTLLGAYCDDVFSGSNKGGWSLFCVLNAPEVDGDDSVRSAQQRRWAASYARDHVAQLPGVVIARFARTLDLYGLDDIIGGDVGEDKERAAVWAGVVMWWALAPIAAFGAHRLRRRHRAVVLTPAIIVAFTTIVFYGNHRLRATLEPSLAVLAAVAIVHWCTPARSADGGGHHPRDTVATDGGELPVG